MKSILAGLMIIFSMNSFSQSNYSIADTAKSWSHVAAGVGSCGVLGTAHTYHTHFCGDTISNGNRYLKVFQATDSLYTDDEMIGLLYEDTFNQQVFYRDLYSGNEGLIYDFSIEEGDSVFIENWYYGSEALLVCDAIDSVIINNEFVKKYSMREPWDDDIEDTWIEGEIEPFVELFPNPCKDKIFIDFNFKKDILLNISIYDVNGRKILEKTGPQPDRMEIDCADFPEGVYMLKLNDLKGQILVIKRFMKI